MNPSAGAGSGGALATVLALLLLWGAMPAGLLR
jgi:hypothetical protein